MTEGSAQRRSAGRLGDDDVDGQSAIRRRWGTRELGIPHRRRLDGATGGLVGAARAAGSDVLDEQGWSADCSGDDDVDVQSDIRRRWEMPLLKRPPVVTTVCPPCDHRVTTA